MCFTCGLCSYIMPGRNRCHLKGLLPSRLAEKCPMTYKEQIRSLDCQHFKLILNDRNYLCRPFLHQIWLRSVYLPAAPHTDNLFLLSPRHSITVSHVAGAPGQNSSVLITALHDYYLKKNASANMTKKSETLCKEVCFFVFYISESLILTEGFICCPDTVRFCVHEQSALVVRFYLQQWAAFWKVTVPVLSLAPRLLHLLSRCPIMKLQVRQHPSHYSLH